MDTALAVTVDSGTNQILVSTFNPSSVEVFNAQSYAMEGQVGIPNCFNNICAQPNDVYQVLVDPTHGDAYLVSTIAFLTLNLSSLSMVGTVVGYGDGPQITAIYSPTSDRIFGTYSSIGMNGPGFVVQLFHGFYLMLTSLLWVPTAVGLLVCAAVVGALLAVLRFRGPPVQPRTSRSGPGSYIQGD